MLVRGLRFIVRHLIRFRFLKAGRKVVFDPLTSTLSYGRISVGNNVFIGGRAWFSATHARIIIGSNVMFGPGVYIFGGNHRFDEVGQLLSQQKKTDDHVDPDVVIEDDVWVGGGTVILAGVVIGEGSIIGAGSVVTKSVSSYSIYAGNPARLIRKRFTDDELARHIQMVYPERIPGSLAASIPSSGKGSDNAGLDDV